MESKASMSKRIEPAPSQSITDIGKITFLRHVHLIIENKFHSAVPVGLCWIVVEVNKNGVTGSICEVPPPPSEKKTSIID